MKTALVHDWLPILGGAEKVLESIYELYPSPIYTLLKNRKALKGSVFEDATIHTSLIQNLPFAKTKYRSYLPFFPFAIEQFDLSDYDLVISSSYAVAKGVLIRPDQTHICYCNSPIRYAWDMYFEYLKDAKLEKGFKGLIAKAVLHYIRMWDYASAQRVDYFIANSINVANRIKKFYGRDAYVIYPPVDVDNFELWEQKEDFYLTASRLVPYKKIDLIVEAFSNMPNKKLIVCGDGPQMNLIKKKAAKNIEIIGFASFDKLKLYMQKAKAFVFAAKEDFGIVPVESMSCGTPVIAYKAGGSLETVVENVTGIFFEKQNIKSIVEAVELFERKQDTFDPKTIRSHALQFSKQRFKEQFRSFIEEKILSSQ
ncbi:MAG TPA: glycosyltransferase family 4 protein [Desulfurella acetivorans]|uniref:Glycosyltransferase family 4 protein n=1 Tax=Desulfurella acetivorans TaxID=33002 RepID=A0A7C6A7B9_DESAE|nr:glycosyltransferase family 4 protein [Desulfurella acetivorans]